MALKPVDLTIESVRRNCEGVEDSITTFAQGKWAKHKDAVYVEYDEPSETGMEGTHTVLKWSEGKLRLTRRGGVEHCQEFAPGGVSESLYETAYMSIPMSARTHLAECAMTEHGMEIYVEYFFSLGGEPQGLTKLRIWVREDS